MNKPSWLWAPSYLPINHMLTPHRHHSSPLGSKVSDPVRISLFLLLTLFFPLTTFPHCFPSSFYCICVNPWHQLSSSRALCHFPYLCFTVLGIHLSFTFFSVSITHFSFLYLGYLLLALSCSNTLQLTVFYVIPRLSPTLPPTFWSSCCFKWSV